MTKIFNRPFIAYLDNKKVIIYSLNIIEKIINDELKDEDILVFRTDEHTSKYLSSKMANKVEIKFEIKNYLDADLLLSSLGGGDRLNNKQEYEIETKCKIKQYKINSINKVSTNQELIEVSRAFKGKFVILINDDYYIVHREPNNEYYYRLAIGDVLERIEKYLKECGNLSDDYVKNKIHTLISYEVDNKIDKNAWIRLDENTDFEIVY